jgi:predicted HicB family RNase H-like nuclease
MMEYKGYIGRVEFDDEAAIFHGEVINLRDVITFQGESVQELRQAFQESIEDYLEFCRERQEEPDKPFSGTFTVRISPELHRDLALQAKLANQSLNRWVNLLFEESQGRLHLPESVQNAAGAQRRSVQRQGAEKPKASVGRAAPAPRSEATQEE